jgi:putative transposase
MRPESARAARDRVLTEKIEQVHAANYGVYGVRKVWHELNRQDVQVARCTVERLMRENGLRGLLRDKSPRTTRPAAETGRPGDLVERDVTATRPNELWVADLTYVRTSAFVLDVFSRMIVGWQVATSLYTDLALDALQMAIWRRQAAGADLAGLTHHSDRGVQYRAIRYTQRLAEAGAVASVGSKGDSYNNAMAEAFNSRFKAELVRNRGPWRGLDDLEIATVEYIDVDFSWTRLSSKPRRPPDRPNGRPPVSPATARRQRQSCVRRSGQVSTSSASHRMRSGAAAQRRSGAAAQRRSGAAAQRRSGAAAQRRSGAAAQRRATTPEAWPPAIYGSVPPLIIAVVARLETHAFADTAVETHSRSYIEKCDVIPLPPVLPLLILAAVTGV